MSARADDPAGEPLQRPALAVALTVGAMLVFASMHALVRDLSSELHSFQIAFVRGLVGIGFGALLVTRIGAHAFRPRSPRLMLTRGALGGVGMTLWFLGLSLLPLAEATALSFTTAIFATLGAVLFLGERLSVRRVSAVTIGFLGVLVMLRPGVDTVQFGALVVLAASMVAGVNLCIAKVLVRRDAAEAVVFWTAIMMSVVAAVPAWTVWSTPSALAWVKLVAIGGLGTLGMLGVTHAMRLADASLVVPMHFTRLAWAAALGYLVFGELPDAWTWSGGLLIVASTTYIAVREAQLGRRPARPSPDA